MKILVPTLKSDQIKNIVPFLRYLILSLIILILSFPNVSANYSSGLDGSLPWIFNSLIDKGFAIDQYFIFPHGPLAFLLYPVALGKNLWIALLAYSLIKLLFCIQYFHLFPSEEKINFLSPFVILLILCHLFNLQLFIIGVVACGLLLFIKSNKNQWLIPVYVLSCLAIFIKSYVGIVCLILIISFIILESIRKKDWKRTLGNIGLLSAGFVLFWLLLFGNLSGFFTYFFGVAQLALGNSSATALYPVNNWHILVPAILLFFSIPFINRGKQTLLFFTLFLLAVFAAWKHGMAREDIDHIRGFFHFLVLYFSLYLAFVPRNHFKTLVVSSIVLILFYANMKNVVLYDEYKIQLMRIENFRDFVFNHEKFKNYHKEISRNNIESHRISAEALRIIGDETVDIYPWDYAFVPANDLNWVPRPVLQSYVAYTPWLDSQNAKHFSSSIAPNYIIWELNKDAFDLNGGRTISTDQRYLLNDEPQTIQVLLNQYVQVYQDDQICLLKKQNPGILREPKMIYSESYHWNEWIEVPVQDEGVLRANIACSKNILGMIKSFLYKDEAYFIYYQLNNGENLIYRWVPKNAREGIWINPFIRDPGNSTSAFNVARIQLVTSNKQLNNSIIDIDWELTEIQDVENFLFGNHLKNAQNVSEIDSNSTQFFFQCNCDKTKPCLEWVINMDNFTEEEFLSAPTAEMVSPNSYSSTFQHNIITFLSPPHLNSMNVHAGIWFKGNKKNKANIVISIENHGKATYWESIQLKDFVIDSGEWNYAFIKKSIEPSGFEIDNSSQLKIYVWNNDGKSIFLDDLLINISAQKSQ